MWSPVYFVVLLEEIVPMGFDVTDWWLCVEPCSTFMVTE